MMQRVQLGTIALGVALGLTGCATDAERGDDDYRELEEQVGDLAAEEDEAQEALAECGDGFHECVSDGNAPEDCADDLQTCLEGEIDIPDPPEIPDPLEPPEPPDFPGLPGGGGGFGDGCAQELFDCVADGGGDPMACVDEAQTCFEAELDGICEAAEQSCIDAGAQAEICDGIAAHC